MTASIIAMFFFWPLGIPAVIYAAKVKRLLARNDVPAAAASVAQSKKLSKAAFIVGGSSYLLELIIMLGYVLST